MTVLVGILSSASSATAPAAASQGNPLFYARQRILAENNNFDTFRGEPNSENLYGSTRSRFVKSVPRKFSGAIGVSMGDIHFEAVRVLPNPILLEQTDAGYDRVDGYIEFTNDQGGKSELWARGERTIGVQTFDYAIWSNYYDRPVNVWSASKDFRLATPSNALSFEQGEYKPGNSLLVLAGDGTLPVITLLGPNPLRLQPDDVYVEYGGTVSDEFDGDLTDDLVADSSEVDTSIQATYTVYYRVDDPNGNYATATRTVIVEDTIAPVITLNGPGSIVLEKNAPYVDQGATAFDSYDGDITANIVTFNNVDTSVESTYLITYNVVDAAGNAADQAARIVQVGAYFGHVLRAKFDDGDVVLRNKLTDDLVLRGRLNE